MKRIEGHYRLLQIKKLIDKDNSTFRVRSIPENCQILKPSPTLSRQAHSDSLSQTLCELTGFKNLPLITKAAIQNHTAISAVHTDQTQNNQKKQLGGANIVCTSPKIAADLKRLFKTDPKTQHLQIVNARSRAKEFNSMREAAHHAFSTLYRSCKNPKGIIKKFLLKHEIITIEGRYCLATKIIATVCNENQKEEVVTLSHKLPSTGSNHNAINGKMGGFLHFNLEFKDKRPTCSLNAVDILNALGQALKITEIGKKSGVWKKAFTNAQQFDQNQLVTTSKPTPHNSPATNPAPMPPSPANKHTYASITALQASSRDIGHATLARAQRLQKRNLNRL